MRIADIVALCAEPGAFVLDRTLPSAGVSAYAELSPDHEVSLLREPPAERGRALAIVLSQLPSPRVELGPAGAERAVHVILADALERFIEEGVLEAAAVAGWELASVHATQHPTLRHAVVLRSPASAVERSRLRSVNEYRLSRALLNVREEEVRRLRAALEELGARLDEARREAASARSQTSALSNELAELRAQRDRDAQLVKEAAEARARVRRLEEQLRHATKRLLAARSALSFRLGRATKVALREAASDPLGLPRRWLETFRGPDEVMADLEPPPAGTSRGR